MKKYFTLLLILPFLTFCTSKEEKTNKNTTSEMAEPSELSIIMNDMYKVNMDWKKQIMNGEIPTEIPNHESILTAKSVNERAGSDFYNAMAKSYLIKAKEVTLSTPTNAKENFNSLVSTCISCHEEICFGPIVRIKKLFIN